MRPQYEPKTAEQKLGYLVEECGEALAAVGKLLRWGPDSYNPELPPERRESNRAWVFRELQDLERAIAYAREALATNCEWEISNPDSEQPTPSGHDGKLERIALAAHALVREQREGRPDESKLADHWHRLTAAVDERATSGQ